MGQYRKAEQYIDNCISTFPDTVNAEAMVALYTRLANIHIYQDYSSKAKSSLYKALEFGSLDKYGWTILARAHNQLGEWHRAKAAEKSLELDQNHSQGLAELDMHMKDYKIMIMHLITIIDIGDNTWDDYARSKYYTFI